MKNNNNKILIAIFLSLLFMVVSVASYFYLHGKIKKININTSEASQNLSFELERQVKFSSVEKIISSTEKERELLMSYSIKEEEIVGFIEEIENFAKATNLEIDIPSVSVEDIGGKILEGLVLNIETKGSWSDTFYFLLKLENLSEHVEFRSVIFENSKVAGEDGKDLSIWESSVTIFVSKFK